MTVRIRDDRSYTVTGDWNCRGGLDLAEEDNSDDGEEASSAEGTAHSSRERKEEREEKEEKRKPSVPARPKPLSRQQERSERNRREYLASQSVSAAPPVYATSVSSAAASTTSIAVVAAPPPPPRATKVTLKPKRKGIPLFDEEEKEPRPKTGRERERERLRMQSVKKDSPKSKHTPAPVPQGITIVFVEDRRGSERGLRVQIGREVIGTYWSAGLNLDDYHGRVGHVYQRLVAALLNVFDLETQSFTSDFVDAAGCTWTLEKV